MVPHISVSFACTGLKLCVVWKMIGLPSSMDIPASKQYSPYMNGVCLSKGVFTFKQCNLCYKKCPCKRGEHEAWLQM